MFNNNLQFLLLILIIINLSSLFGNCDDDEDQDCQKFQQKRKQGFRLVLRYPPGWCISMPHDECDGKNEWIIQGFWPTSIITHKTIVDNNRLQYCCHKQKFNKNLLKPIIKQLKLYWPSESYINNDDYYRKQWIQYGSCSHDPMSSNNNYNEQIDLLEYFVLALDLFNRININKWFSNNNRDDDDEEIKPSNKKKINLQKIRHTLNNHLNQLNSFVVYELRCSHDYNNNNNKTAKRNILNEIRFCFDDQLNFIDCTKFIDNDDGDDDEYNTTTGLCNDQNVYYIDKYGWP